MFCITELHIVMPISFSYLSKGSILKRLYSFLRLCFIQFTDMKLCLLFNYKIFLLEKVFKVCLNIYVSPPFEPDENDGTG